MPAAQETRHSGCRPAAVPARTVPALALQRRRPFRSRACSTRDRPPHTRADALARVSWPAAAQALATRLRGAGIPAHRLPIFGPQLLRNLSVTPSLQLAGARSVRLPGARHQAPPHGRRGRRRHRDAQRAAGLVAQALRRASARSGERGRSNRAEPRGRAARLDDSAKCAPRRLGDSATTRRFLAIRGFQSDRAGPGRAAHSDSPSPRVAAVNVRTQEAKQVLAVCLYHKETAPRVAGCLPSSHHPPPPLPRPYRWQSDSNPGPCKSRWRFLQRANDCM